eukprot:TRINITY_DN85581_c0_g1_i1.p1 TRINITY_DN85581_c0_g1~~TRINITY_DN85581_c0_g1_i1.p1  ORF type:complete len:181 (-),score=46.32 TRINITY_DN85581_c0_g1_i1:24-566(-)
MAKKAPARKAAKAKPKPVARGRSKGPAKRAPAPKRAPAAGGRSKSPARPASSARGRSKAPARQQSRKKDKGFKPLLRCTGKTSLRELFARRAMNLILEQGRRESAFIESWNDEALGLVRELKKEQLKESREQLAHMRRQKALADEQELCARERANEIAKLQENKREIEALEQIARTQGVL